MKKNIIATAVLGFGLLATSAFAQTISVGPFLMGKVSGLNTSEIPTGTKTGAAFVTMPDIGVYGQLKLPASPISFGLGLGLRSVSLVERLATGVDEYENVFTTRLSYFAFSPTVNVGGFVLGLNYGVPVSANTHFSPKNGSATDTDPGTSSMNPLLEVFLGGQIPLVEMRGAGSLNLLLQAGYTMSGLEKDPIDSKYNPKVVSASIGLSYLFDISK